MATLNELVEDFLAQKRIAVAGVSRSGEGTANLIYRKLRDSGYQVFALNPHATEIEGDTCYPNLIAIPGGVAGVVVATTPEVTLTIAQECVDLGISRIWMHRSFGPGSVSEEAVALCRRHNMQVIDGACPMMFCQPVDMAHACMRWVLRVTGGLPKVG